MIPSRIKLIKNEEIKMTQPHPPSGFSLDIKTLESLRDLWLITSLTMFKVFEFELRERVIFKIFLRISNKICELVSCQKKNR